MKKDFFESVDRLQDPDPYIRSLQAMQLGSCRKREALPLLLPLSFDPNEYVRRDTIIALGETHDSRAYFFLANYFFLAEEYFSSEESLQLQRSVLYAFRANKDPRSNELLQKVESEYPELQSLALSVLRTQRLHPRINFLYTYIGKDEEKENAKEFSGKKIKNQDDLQSLDQILEEEVKWSKGHFEKPQTYVITTKGDFLLGGELHEHVQVASGEDVLAAGEAYMRKTESGLWSIKEMNNRSNGYYPHASCVLHVTKSLEKTGIDFPSTFSHEYPNNGWIDSDLLEIYKSSLFKKKKT